MFSTRLGNLIVVKGVEQPLQVVVVVVVVVADGVDDTDVSALLMQFAGAVENRGSRARYQSPDEKPISARALKARHAHHMKF